MNDKIYDVAICGSGLAGLTLARQLKLKMPELSIVLLDRLARPLPQAGFKVGESTVEVGAYYLANVLQLTDYFENNHFHKLGFRYFLGDTTGDFHKRPEIGIFEFHPPYSYQIDRGVVESDLRQFNLDAGIELLENCQIKDIELASDSVTPHQVVYSQREEKETRILNARWVIDSTGRRRLLQKKLGLAKPFESEFSAVWFRVEGRFDVNDFVPETEREWHQRDPEKIRYFSTNHLCGEGYWVWIIPLSSGYTSLGIVTHENVHPFGTYHTYEKAFQWLEKHEPAVAHQLKNKPPIDFEKIPQYTYSSKQVFSLNRWACVGVAGVFADPFYSPGTDLIGFGNSLITQMIELDRQGQLTQKTVDEANRFLISYNESVTSHIHGTYLCFGNETVMTMKFLWDVLTAWAFSAPLMFNMLFLEPSKRVKVRKGTGEFFLLSHRMNQFFRDWLAKSQRRGSFEFIDYLKIPFVSELRTRNLKSNKTEQELIDDHLASIQLFEELVQVMFLLALEDTMPEKLAQFSDNVWLNAWAISLDPERWEIDRLFRPTTKPRDLRPMMAQMRQIIQFNPTDSSVTKELVTV
ncbi:tryptophan 7-halogenase [Pannus brasiliensis CCIBt3594]|uniref:Tryptophan 7-halogenase n=1 Tax=Pannus brasiliensis CCIBt3594 TaxID=1427578 RepID=A0AAW9QRG2_9CHRO